MRSAVRSCALWFIIHIWCGRSAGFCADSAFKKRGSQPSSSPPGPDGSAPTHISIETWDVTSAFASALAEKGPRYILFVMGRPISNEMRRLPLASVSRREGPMAHPASRLRRAIGRPISNERPRVLPPLLAETGRHHISFEMWRRTPRRI